MQDNLVIVESPAKAKKIEQYLGKDYKVMSSYGHIRDLKRKELSVDEKTLNPDYEIPEEPIGGEDDSGFEVDVDEWIDVNEDIFI